jgi:hypothetical protein
MYPASGQSWIYICGGFREVKLQGPRKIKLWKPLTVTSYLGYNNFFFNSYLLRSRDSVVGIATSYGLDDQGFGVRVPWDSRQHFLPQIRVFPFFRILQLVGLRWRYSTQPAHGKSAGFRYIRDYNLLLYRLRPDHTENTAPIFDEACLQLGCLAMAS